MFKEAVKTNLLALVDAYRAATGASLVAVSKKFYGRTDFFEQFSRGECTISIDRLDAMLAKLNDEWPEGAQKPTLRPVFMLRRK